MLKLFLSEFKNKQRSISDFLNHNLSNCYTDKDIIDFFIKAQQSEVIANSAIGNKIVDYLQLLNNIENYNQITLDEIGEIYLELIKVHPNDITLYESAFYFFDSVMDNSQFAHAILKEGVIKIETKINALKSVISE